MNSEGEDTEFVTVQAMGEWIRLGTDGSSVAANERVVMYAGFSQNFKMASTEVTRAQFKKMMGYLPEELPSGSNDVPVTHVSWFEALVYCNRLSQSLGLDTVYSYQALNWDQNNRLVDIDGLQVHWDVAGIRLPTEAEWMFASREIVGDANLWAWHSRNSGNRLHSVAQKKATSEGLFDLTGNAMEWMQDGLVNFVQDSLMNYGGLLLGDVGHGERVVKGGSFMHDTLYLSRTRRSDVYSLAGYERLDYLGFRPVLSSGMEAVFLESSGTQQGAVHVSAQVSSQDLLTFMDRHISKLVFVEQDGGRLSLFSSFEGLTIFSDTGTITHPVLSPDGKWIAYGTRYEGQRGEGTLMLRSTDPARSPILLGEGNIPRWWIKPSTGDTGLVWVESAMANDLEEWSQTQTYWRKVSDGQWQGSAEVLSSQGGFHSGISQNGQFLASGYRNLLLLDRNHKTSQVLFQYPQNGKDSLGSDQVCNVSMAPDSSGKMLFLDFGYSEQSLLTGSSYGIHEYLFMMNTDGHVYESIQVPEGYTGWDYPEWSNHSRYAVSALRNSEDAARTIGIVDLKTHEMKEVIGGGEVAFPSLWVSHDRILSDFPLDSAGAYALPNRSDYQAIYAYRMQQFWLEHLHDHFFVFGNSQVADGFDPNVFSRRGYNMGCPACDLRTSYDMMQTVLNVADSVDWVLLGISPDWFTNEWTDYSWDEGVSTSLGRIYDSIHGYWQEGASTQWLNYLNQVLPRYTFNTVPGRSLPGGCFTFPALGWGDLIKQSWASGVKAGDAVLAKNVNRVKQIVQMAREKGVIVLLVVFPTHPGYLDSPLYFASGISDKAAHWLLSEIEDFANQDPGVFYFDGNRDGDHDYGDESAYDVQHLSGHGAMLFANEVRDQLMTWGVLQDP